MLNLKSGIFHFKFWDFFRFLGPVWTLHWSSKTTSHPPSFLPLLLLLLLLINYAQTQICKVTTALLSHAPVKNRLIWREQLHFYAAVSWAPGEPALCLWHDSARECRASLTPALSSWQCRWLSPACLLSASTPKWKRLKTVNMGSHANTHLCKHPPTYANIHVTKQESTHLCKVTPTHAKAPTHC